MLFPRVPKLIALIDVSPLRWLVHIQVAEYVAECVRVLEKTGLKFKVRVMPASQSHRALSLMLHTYIDAVSTLCKNGLHVPLS